LGTVQLYKCGPLVRFAPTRAKITGG